MDEEQKKWQRQFLNNSGGTREVFRIGCAIAIWLGIGIGLYLWSDNLGYMLICIGIFFIFVVLSAVWQPAYSLLRKIYGNENIPHEVMPHESSWWSYIPLVILLVISIALVVRGIAILIK